MRRSSAAQPAEAGNEVPDLTLLTNRLKGPLGVSAIGVTLLALCIVLVALYVARAFFLPVTVALLLNLLLSPLVASLRKVHVPSPIGAAIVLVVCGAIIGSSIYRLAGPAADLIESVPDKLVSVEAKLRGIQLSIEKVERTTDKIEEITEGDTSSRAPEMQSARPSLTTTLLNQTRSVVLGIAVVVFLLYFLLSSGDLFLRKLVSVLPSVSQKRRAVKIIRTTELQVSQYILTILVINVCLGASVGTVLWLLGMPSPVLWGVMVALLNFVPYIGGLLGVGTVAVVSLVTFDTLGQAVWPPLLYLTINAIEGNLVTPAILGQRFRMNPVAVFVSLLFWTWMWGVPGAILAVPLLVTFKIACDNIRTLSAIGVFLGR